MNFWSDPYWLVAAATALATTIAAIVALFGDAARRKWFPPKLTCELLSVSGDITTVTLTPNLFAPPGRLERARYYHLRATNGRPWSTANNAVVYLVRIELPSADGEFYTRWVGEAPLSWRHGELYSLLRPIGASSLDADFVALVKNKWLELCIVTRPTGIPNDTVSDPPGRWRNAVKMKVSVQIKSTEAESAIYRYAIDWDGKWEDGDTEIQRHLAIKLLPSDFS